MRIVNVRVCACALMALPLGTLMAGSGDRAQSASIEWRLDRLGSLGGVKPEIWGAPQGADGGMGFDGQRDGVLVPHNPLAGWKEFTVEVWFCPAEGGEREQRFFHAQEADAQGMRALVEARFDGSGGWWLDTFLRTKGDARTLIDPRHVHPTGKWYWVALRYDGKTMAHFVDGEKEAEGEVAFGPMAEGKVSLGVRQNRTYWFKGAIRAVRFTPVALPAEELQRVK